MQQLRILSTFSITQDTENAIEKLQKAEKELSRKGGGNLAPRDRVMDKNCVKASYNTTSGFHDVNESKWCNAYADDAFKRASSICAVQPFVSVKFCSICAESTLSSLSTSS